MARMTRWTWSMLAVEALASGGTNLPSSRKDLALDMRRSDEADGERRMMGSGLLVGPFWLREREDAAPGAETAWAFFWINGAASLRTCEKSCVRRLALPKRGGWWSEKQEKNE